MYLFSASTSGHAFPDWSASGREQDAETLLATPLKPVPFIVDGLIPCGLHILAGSPKIGKSWLMLWLWLKVAAGESYTINY